MGERPSSPTSIPDHGASNIRGFGAVFRVWCRRNERPNDRTPQGRVFKYAQGAACLEEYLVKDSVTDELRALKQQPGDPLRSMGSIGLVKSMMQLGLVDRLRLIVFPVVLGVVGREPIYAGYPRTGLELIDTKVLDSRLIVLEYRPLRP